MELRQLRYFMAVADHLHFGRAAERLSISQSPLSHQVRQLEAELGVRLLERTTRRVHLTAAGEELKRRMSQLLPQLDDAVVGLSSVQAGRAGRVTVGFVSSASYTLVPRAIRRFAVTHPDVEVVLRPLTSAEQVEALLDGAIDIGLLRGEDPSLADMSEVLLVEDLVACLPEDHPLAANNSLAPADLAQVPMISFPHQAMPAFVNEVRAVFAAVGLPPVAQRTIHQETALGLVAAGVGAVILPHSVSQVRPPGVEVRPIDGAPTSTVVAATPPRGLRGFPATRSFLEGLRAVASDLAVRADRGAR